MIINLHSIQRLVLINIRLLILIGALIIILRLYNIIKNDLKIGEDKLVYYVGTLSIFIEFIIIMIMLSSSNKVKLECVILLAFAVLDFGFKLEGSKYQIFKVLIGIVVMMILLTKGIDMSWVFKF